MPIPIRKRHYLLFFRRFLKSPSTVGGLTPSSRFLAKHMVKHVPWQEVQSVAELGPGTGIFTRYILKRKRPESQLLLFERDPDMRSRLAAQLPDFPIYEDARDLPRALQENNIQELDCIISGLPFAIFPQDLRDQIMDAVLQSLKPGGLFVTFQYSLQMRKQLTKRFSTVDIHFSAGNLPPAFVYVCKK